MIEILKLLLADKGRDINRTIVLALLCYQTYQLIELQKDVAVLKNRVGIVQTNAPNKIAKNP